MDSHAQDMVGTCQNISVCTGVAVKSSNCSTTGFVCCIEELHTEPHFLNENPILTRDIFLKIVGNTSRNRAMYFYFVESLAYAQIQSEFQLAAYLAQLVGETDYFKAIDSSQAESDFDSQLGNNQTGDGVKFRGRGAILLRGRTNYYLASTKIKGW